MSLPMRVAAHTVVLGAALVAAAVVRPAGDGAAPAGAVDASTVRPPTVTMTLEPVEHRHAPAGAHRRHRHHATPPAPRAASIPRTRSQGTPAPAPHHRARAPRRAVTGPTDWAALNAAIARIPTYHSGGAIWLVSTKYGYWGTADWYRDVLYISPSVPTDRLYDVAVHEWSHELSVLDYGGDVNTAVAAMNAWFGGSGLTGAERAADCMAILQGATWTHYTTCTNSRWRTGAAKLVGGSRL